MSVRCLLQLAGSHRAREAKGIASVCSAHPVVLRAAVQRAKSKHQPVLIEATCNQVNQFGGYTGMTPIDFVAFVKEIAHSEGVSMDQVIFGGDHLGPNPWRHEPKDIALQKASDLIATYVAAGFTKIHIDASMGCAGEAVALDNDTVAQRAAVLCLRAEKEAERLGLSPPVYVLGTEVPIPGGVDHAITVIEPTSSSAARETIQIHRQAFERAGLSTAFTRVIAFVVQPGVEFGSENVLPFNPSLAGDLSSVLDDEHSLVFEAHSTDYQSAANLRALVSSGFSILKVGPELTFAYREALYTLDLLACEVSKEYAVLPLRKRLEEIMLDEPSKWRSYYHGSDNELRLQRHYSYSDRIRYYWHEATAKHAVDRLMVTLRSHHIPETLLRQFMPDVARSTNFEPENYLLDAVNAVLVRYDQAAGAYVSISRPE